ncbi:MAG: beta-mannosidase [Candidatus Helarchaeota archaeon]
MKKTELRKHWKLMSDGYNGESGGVKIDVEVPSTVFEVLIGRRVIDDPFYGLNEKEARWVSDSDWSYETDFEVSDEILNKKIIIIRFDGIDTISEIYLNGEMLGFTENMFRRYEFKINSIIKKRNKLKVIIRSPVRYASDMIKKNGHKLYIDVFGFPGVQYIRKAQYSFGWDWGPELSDLGIWRPVEIIGYDNVWIDDVYIVQNFKYKSEGGKPGADKGYENIKVENVELSVQIELGMEQESTEFGKINDNYEIEVKLTSPTGRKIIKNKRIKSKKVILEINLEEPELWWTHDLGKPNLYKLKILVKSGDNVLDKKEMRIGIRDIRLIRENDKWGESFYFKLNGYPVFMKGANWVPIDQFLVRGKKLGLYKKLIRDVRLGNMNMIRVWGGGIYEDDEFYDLCDENGILVWQDFMFACGIYPPGREFLDNVKEEAIYNIKRLRNHPSLAIWCGNNEVEWFLGIGLILIFVVKFKFKKKREHKRGNLYLFEELLLKLVNEHDPNHPYWPSSPSNGAMFNTNKKIRGILNSNSPDMGDAHYWDVWHRGKPFSAYRKFTPRFMSEFGFQSFPSIKTIKNFCPEDQLQFFSDVMKSHQKNKSSMLIFPAGNKKVMKYMKRRFRVSADFEKQVKISQITQAEAIEYGVEHWRRSRNENHCMGTLYWQLNDCWPVISWSSIDYYGRWKALHYAARRFYSPLFASVEESKKDAKFYITNDYKESKNGILKWGLLNVDGDILLENTVEFKVLPCSTINVDYVDFRKLRNDKQRNEVIFIQFKLYDMNNNELSSNIRIIEAPKFIKLKNPELSWELIMIDSKNFEIKLKTNGIALYVNIDSRKFDFIASDNYFSLSKGEERIIKLNLEEAVSKEELEETLEISSLYELMND